MPPATCLVTGIVYENDGETPKEGVRIRIKRIELSGVALTTNQRKVAITNEDGVICRVDENGTITETEGFEVPRNAEVWLYGTFTVGSTSFNVDAGVRVSIPDSASVSIESLGAAVTGPTSGLTVYEDDAPLSGLFNSFKFESDSCELEVESAGVLIVRPVGGGPGGSTDWGDIGGTLANQTDLNTALGLKAPLASPVLTGTPTAPTASNGTNTTQIATTAFVAAGFQPLDSDLTTIAGLTATTDNFMVANASAWASRTPAQAKTSLSLNNVDNTSDATKNAASVTLTNKTIALGSNSVSGTLSQFNSALSDADFASLAGSETLTNKTLASPLVTGSLTVGSNLANQVVLEGSATGDRLEINAVGSDDDIALILQTKGQGSLLFGNEALSLDPMEADTYFAFGAPILDDSDDFKTHGVKSVLATLGSDVFTLDLYSGYFHYSHNSTGDHSDRTAYGSYGLVTNNGGIHGNLWASGALVHVGGTSQTDLAAGFHVKSPQVDGSASIGACAGIWIDDQQITGIDNPYAFWYDGTGDDAGVYRINGLGIMAYYNPEFEAYEPGAVDHERIIQQWVTNEAQYGVEVGGTGVLRPLRLLGSEILIDNVSSSADSVVTVGGTQTLTNKTLGSCTVDGTDAVGFRNIPINSQSANYTAVLADSGKAIFHPASDTNNRTFTIPANASVAYPVGTCISFINKVNTVTIAINSDTLTWAEDGSTGSRSLAPNSVAVAVKITSTEWLINGTGLS